MDFVVVGLGIGALAVLLGLTIRDGGGRWWPRRGGEPGAPAETAHRLAIGRACRAGGLVLAVSGAAILAVTTAALVLGVADRVGAMLVMAAVAAAMLGGIAWAVLYAHQYHPRPRARGASRRHEVSDEPPEIEAPSLAGTIDASVARLGAVSATDPTPSIAVSEGEDEPAIPDVEPAPEPAAEPPPDGDTAAIASEAPTPEAPVSDERAATPEAEQTAAEGASEALSTSRTGAYATSGNRET